MNVSKQETPTDNMAHWSSTTSSGGVEYEFGTNPSEEQSPRHGEHSRVMMVYDESGNAVPMPLGRFYYDTVNIGSDEEESEEEDENGRHASDTERQNKPAALAMSPDSGSEGEHASEDGTEYESYDESEEEDDQFMQIKVPAALPPAENKVGKSMSLKHASSRRTTEARLTNKMSRAMSNVKGTPNDRDRKASPSPHRSSSQRLRQADGDRDQVVKSAPRATETRLRVGAVGRMLSRSKSKKSPNAVSEQQSRSAENRNFQPSRPGSDQIREERNQTGPSEAHSRQSLSSVGRLLSKSKHASSKAATQGIDAAKPPGNEGTASAPNATGTAVATAALATQNSTAGDANRDRTMTEERPRPSNASAATKRMGVQQIGRMLSFQKKKPSPALKSPPGEVASSAERKEDVPDLGSDRERRETERLGQSARSARLGVKQVGRMMSLSKRPSAARATPGTDSEAQPSAPRSVAVDEGGRSKGEEKTAALKKEYSRMSLKNAGRMMSFSRKPLPKSEEAPLQPSKTPGQAVVHQGPDSAGAASSPPQIGPKSPRLDGRANKFFFSELYSEELKRTKALAQHSHVRVPVVVMAEYSGPVSKTKWFIDAFTLPHNAVRREIIDLYDIIMALARGHGQNDITRHDMRQFRSWWSVASGFFLCYFKMEQTVLIPWVDGAGSKDWELQTALSKMKSMTGGLQDQLKEIDSAWESADTLSAGETFARVYTLFDVFCPRVMNYFADQELLLPAIVKGTYRVEDRLVMDKAMTEAFLGESLTRKNKDLPHHNLILLIRWIANPRQLRAWVAKNLNSTGRASYNRWHGMYEAEHASIVKEFRNRNRAALSALK